jgi:hypothetical protein
MRKDSLQESLQETVQKLPAVPRKLSKGSASNLSSGKSSSGGFAAAVVATAASPAGFDAAASEQGLQDGCSLYGSCSSGSFSTIPAVCQTGEDLQLMTTKEQLEDAAAAFKEHLHLQQRQSELFGQASAAAAAAGKDPHLAVAPGAEVAGDTAGAAAAAAVRPPGASSWAKYKALLWREVLVMTRYVLLCCYMLRVCFAFSSLLAAVLCVCMQFAA